MCSATGDPEWPHPPRCASCPKRPNSSENVVPRRFGTFISAQFIATYVFEVLKTSLKVLFQSLRQNRVFARWRGGGADRAI